jgi:hypothetical protein
MPANAAIRRARFENSNKKPAADFSARALCDFRDDVDLPLICPTCQILFRAVNKLRKMQRNRFDHLKLSLRIALPSIKSPLPVSGRGLYDIGDDVDVPLICPTRQAPKICSAHRRSNGSLGRCSA